MPDFVALWVYLASKPLFGLTATLSVYVLAMSAYRRVGQAPWANPVLWSMLVLATALVLTGVDYGTYFAGAQFIHFLLGPAVVALGWPLYERLGELRQHWHRILLAALVGGTIAAVTAVGLGALFGLPREVLLSLAPKSVTAPVAMGVAEKIGGLPSLTVVLVIITGIVGAMGFPALFRWLGIRDHATQGFSVGLAAHGLGTARAFMFSEEMGAFSALAMGLNGLLTALLLPILLPLLKPLLL